MRCGEAIIMMTVLFSSILFDFFLHLGLSQQKKFQPKCPHQCNYGATASPISDAVDVVASCIDAAHAEMGASGR